jgi:hypothetical protein
MAARDIELLERHRLMEAQPRPELDDDQTLQAVHALMRRNKAFREGIEEIVQEVLISRGANLAISMGLDLHDALEE